jgi:hypothetical protein
VIPQILMTYTIRLSSEETSEETDRRTERERERERERGREGGGEGAESEERAGVLAYIEVFL